jgi:predicted nucleotidyltransferase component of viral defense system
MKRPVRGLKDNRILNKIQKGFLERFVHSDLSSHFRLSGGTALSAFYLEHRYSEDIDLFSSEKVPLYAIERFLKSIPFVERFVITKLYDRNIFLIKTREKRQLKVEFTHYPLKLIDKINIIDGLQIESFLDIVVNKLCAITDRVEPKDFVDLFCAMRQEKLSLERLLDLAEKKCEIEGISHVLKTRLSAVPDGIEKLSLVIPVTRKVMEDFFYREIKRIIEKEIGD